jgi:hypothetical protein
MLLITVVYTYTSLFERQIRLYRLKILTVQWNLLPSPSVPKMDAVSSSTTSELSSNHTETLSQRLCFVHRTARVTERNVNLIIGSVGNWATNLRREPELVDLIGRERSEGTRVKVKVGEMGSNSGSCWQVAKVIQGIFVRMSPLDPWGTFEFMRLFSDITKYLFMIHLLTLCYT